MSTGNHFLDYFPLSIPISVFSTSGFLMFYCRNDICYATGRETMYIILGMYWKQPVEEDSPNRMQIYINKMPEPDCYNLNYSVDTPEKKDIIISAFSRVFIFVRTGPRPESWLNRKWSYYSLIQNGRITHLSSSKDRNCCDLVYLGQILRYRYRMLHYHCWWSIW